MSRLVLNCVERLTGCVMRAGLREPGGSSASLGRTKFFGRTRHAGVREEEGVSREGGCPRCLCNPYTVS